MACFTGSGGLLHPASTAAVLAEENSIIVTFIRWAPTTAENAVLGTSEQQRTEEQFQLAALPARALFPRSTRKWVNSVNAFFSHFD